MTQTEHHSLHPNGTLFIQPLPRRMLQTVDFLFVVFELVVDIWDRVFHFMSSKIDREARGELRMLLSVSKTTRRGISHAWQGYQRVV